jgi:hypothetical protein
MSEGQKVTVEPKVNNASTHVEGFSKTDEAAIAIAEEHRLSVRDVLRNDKRIVWWCFFFSMSAIGWYVVFQIIHQIPLMNMAYHYFRGFDAQVNGAMISVPAFRLKFG